MKHNIVIFFCIAVIINCVYLNNIFAITTHSKYVKKTPLNKSISSNVLINNKNNGQGILSDSTLEDSIIKEYIALKQSEINFKHTHRIAWYSIKGVLFWCISIVLVLFSGVVSGLTLGFMSVSEDSLCKYYKTASVVDKFFIYDILLIKKNHHKLLVTLLLCNSIALEALPIFLDRLMRSWIAVLLSVTVVLIFGEIIPQAMCSSKLRMQILMASIPIVKCLIKTFSFISNPIAKLLDCFVEPSAEKTTKSYVLTCHEMGILFTEYCRRNAWADGIFKFSLLQEHVITLGFLLQHLKVTCCSKALGSAPTVKTTTELSSLIRRRVTNATQIIPVYSGSSKMICGFVPKHLPYAAIKKVENMDDLVVNHYTTCPSTCSLLDVIDACIRTELVLLVESISEPCKLFRQSCSNEGLGTYKGFVTQDFIYNFFFNPDTNSISMNNVYSLESGSEAFREYYFPEPYSVVNVENDMQTRILGYYYPPNNLLSFKKCKRILVDYLKKKKNLVLSKIIPAYKKLIRFFSPKALRSCSLKKKNLKEPLINSVKEEQTKSKPHDVLPAI